LGGRRFRNNTPPLTGGKRGELADKRDDEADAKGRKTNLDGRKKEKNRLSFKKDHGSSHTNGEKGKGIHPGSNSSRLFRGEGPHLGRERRNKPS